MDDRLAKGRHVATLVRAIMPFLPAESRRQYEQARGQIQGALKSHPLFGVLALAVIAIEMEEADLEAKAAGSAKAQSAMQTALEELAKSAQAGGRGNT